VAAELHEYFGPPRRGQHPGRVRARRQNRRQWRLQPVLRDYIISGNRIKIGPLASTRKACPGLIRVETAFFATLEAAKSFEQNDTGTKLAQFVQAEPE
jgi:META domain